MKSVTINIDGKSATGEINLSASIKCVRKYITKELDLDPEDYWVSVSNTDETSVNIGDIASGNMIIHLNHKVNVRKEDFKEIPKEVI